MKKAVKTLRIVLTGGPGAGKTEALKILSQIKVPKIVIAPETATLLYSGGFPRFASKPSVQQAQRAIFEVQHALEEVLKNEFPGHTLILDRGTIDGAAYWPGGEKQFFKAMGSTLKKELSRYDAVLFLETSAKRFQKIPRGNKHRTETALEAIQLEERLESLWKRHPHFHYIENEKHLKDKLQKVKAVFESIT